MQRVDPWKDRKLAINEGISLTLHKPGLTARNAEKDKMYETHGWTGFSQREAGRVAYETGMVGYPEMLRQHGWIYLFSNVKMQQLECMRLNFDAMFLTNFPIGH